MASTYRTTAQQNLDLGQFIATTRYLVHNGTYPPKFGRSPDRYLHLDATNRHLIDVRPGEHTRLGFAVQLGAARFLGTVTPRSDRRAMGGRGTRGRAARPHRVVAGPAPGWLIARSDRKQHATMPN